MSGLRWHVNQHFLAFALCGISMVIIEQGFLFTLLTLGDLFQLLHFAFCTLFHDSKSMIDRSCFWPMCAVSYQMYDISPLLPVIISILLFVLVKANPICLRMNVPLIVCGDVSICFVWHYRCLTCHLRRNLYKQSSTQNNSRDMHITTTTYPV